MPWFFDLSYQGELYVSVLVEEEGFRIGGVGKILPFVRKVGSDYDYNTLENLLTLIKDEYPERRKDLTFIFPDDLSYGEIAEFIRLGISTGLEPERISMAQHIKP